MSGGTFTLQGGFWSVISVVQSPGAPTLSVSQNGSFLKITWRKPADGWMLESTPALSVPTSNWNPVSPAPQDDGTNLYVTFSMPPGNAFFRLRKL
jgi:hypothetical protein